MLENLPYSTIPFRDLTVEGYSRAAVQSYWRVPELRIGFDLGGQPWEFMGTPNWFVSHAHLDHIAALPVYVARRRMMKMEPPRIYLPEPMVDNVQRLLNVVSRLDRGRLPCELIAVKEDSEIELSRELVVSAHATKHTVPSLGYVVWQRRKKLKPEFQGLSGEQIRDLRLAGQEVSEERRTPLLAYLGDSRPESLDDHPVFYQASVLILEMTFVAARHRKERIHKLGHIHLDDIVARQHKFQNELIIASHFSTRYHGRQIQAIVERAFPDMLGARLQLVI